MRQTKGKFDFWIFFVFIFGLTAWSAPWTSISYTTANSGLHSNSVNSIAIDSFGVKWIGTANGLHKFDGTNWTWYNMTNSGIPDDYVKSVSIDRTGLVWVGTSGGGLSYFDGNTWNRIHTFNSQLPSNNVYAPIFDRFGDGWIITGLCGVVKLDTNRDMTIYNRFNSGLPGDMVYSLVFDMYDNIWLATWEGGISLFDRENWKLYTPNNSPLTSKRTSVIGIDKKGKLWIGIASPATLFEFDYDAQKWTAHQLSEEVYSILFDEKGVGWFGTNHGLLKYDGNAWTKLFPQQLYTTSVALDPKDSTLWIGSSLGLIHFNKNADIANEIISRNEPYHPRSEFVCHNDKANSNLIHIRFSHPPKGNVLINVFDMIGTSVKSYSMTARGENELSMAWDASACAAGAYFVHLKSKMGLYTKRIVLVK